MLPLHYIPKMRDADRAEPRLGAAAGDIARNSLSLERLSRKRQAAHSAIDALRRSPLKSGVR